MVLFAVPDQRVLLGESRPHISLRPRLQSTRSNKSIYAVSSEYEPHPDEAAMNI